MQRRIYTALKEILFNYSNIFLVASLKEIFVQTFVAVAFVRSYFSEAIQFSKSFGGSAGDNNRIKNTFTICNENKLD